MAVFPLRNAYVSVNGVDLSNHCRSVNVTTSRPEIDVTAMGATFQQFIGGIPDANYEFEFFQDFAIGSTDGTLWPLVNSDTPVTVEVRPVNAARSTTNPGFTMSALLLGDYSPVSGSVGEAAMTNLSLRNAGSTGVQRQTS